ncbi:Pal1 cell morphology protein-domain-containing protein [Lentinula aff. detonsa]|uniref:Pal1 cell morphology protein-domain-containing protein n=1 Tax=Lentinula detonsa TaxID=2804962 RepID=A0AA38Q6G3_9AGAR|nr:Pal1 cell morphology protein-domain-containing protein [Lentinula aff. detonsa]KAJ3987766.1 Pal1 cell morphology protein-domain-containing protein [Lentinula detonsa]
MSPQSANPFSDPPQPPPKSRHHRMHSRPADLEKAVVDTVTINGRRMGRSNTSAPPPSRVPQLGPRSQSTDSTPSEKRRLATSKAEKNDSQHADVIDRLDITGVGLTMFHHDGPFDACAPSRNRHRTKAPMMAWSADLSHADQTASDSPYPSPRKDSYPNTYYEPPKKKVDAIAEAWGTHEPEPFEEFFAGGGTRGDTPASSIYNGKDSHAKRKQSREAREAYREYLSEQEARSRPARRRDIPPPQPIFVPDANTVPAATDIPPMGTSPSSPGLPKRSKSLMHRIRKMRDNPNVPVGTDYEDVPSSPPAPIGIERSRERPTHRSNNSFLGRFGSPKPTTDNPLSEPFIFIAPSNGTREKELPPPPADGYSPGDNGPGGYFEAGSPSGTGLGRKTSLMKKVGRVVRGRP